MLRFEELTEDAQVLSTFELMRVLRPSLPRDTYVEEVRALEPLGYRLIGGYLDAEFAELVVLAGARPARSLGRGPHAYVNELVTHPAHRGKGYAKEMLRHIAAQAAANGLPKLYLLSFPAANGYYDKLAFNTLEATPRWIECAKLNPEP